MCLKVLDFLLLLQVAELLIDPVCRGIFAGSIRELSIKSCFKQLYDYEQKYRSIVLGMLRGSKGGTRRKFLCVVKLIFFSNYLVASSDIKG